MKIGNKASRVHSCKDYMALEIYTRITDLSKKIKSPCKANLRISRAVDGMYTYPGT